MVLNEDSVRMQIQSMVGKNVNARYIEKVINFYGICPAPYIQKKYYDMCMKVVNEIQESIGYEKEVAEEMLTDSSLEIKDLSFAQSVLRKIEKDNNTLNLIRSRLKYITPAVAV